MGKELELKQEASNAKTNAELNEPLEITSIEELADWLTECKQSSADAISRALQMQLNTLNMATSPILMGMAMDTLAMCLLDCTKGTKDEKEKEDFRVNFALMLQSIMFINEARFAYELRKNKDEVRELLAFAGAKIAESAVGLGTMALQKSLGIKKKRIEVSEILGSRRDMRAFIDAVANACVKKKELEDIQKESVNAINQLFMTLDKYATVFGPSVVLYGIGMRYTQMLVALKSEVEFAPIRRKVKLENLSKGLSEISEKLSEIKDASGLTKAIASIMVVGTNRISNERITPDAIIDLFTRIENTIGDFERDKQELEAAIEDLKKERKSLGLFKKEEKHTIDEKIADLEENIANIESGVKKFVDLRREHYSIYNETQIMAENINQYREELMAIVAKYEIK